MIVCNVSIPGRPVPWARAVSNASGDGGRHTAPAQKGFKKVVEQYLSWHRPRIVLQPKGVPLNLACRVFLPWPPAMELTEVAAISAAGSFVAERPDLDNWLKLPMDAANKIVWADDGQVATFDGSGKWYSDAPRLEFVVTRLVP